MIVFATFMAMACWTLVSRESRASALSRTNADWLIDGTGLVMQGFIVPALQTLVVYLVCLSLFPGFEGRLNLPTWASFLLNFVLVDYAYYWNHRVLHSARLWKIHRTHHDSTVVDVFTTSRNVIYAPFFIVYLWLNGTLVFLLGDPKPFLAAAALTASLDLWRHTRLTPKPDGLWHKALSLLLITPVEHHLHHSDSAGVNFGANLSCWDRVHGTYVVGKSWPTQYGNETTRASLWKRLLFP